MLLPIVKVAAACLAGASVLTLAAPLVGEAIATLPPIYPAQPANPRSEFNLAFEEVTFPTDGGLALRGWFVPACQPGAPAVVYAPATAKDQRSGLSLLPALHQAGFHVLLFSYRGHAQSEGRRHGFTYGEGESRDVDAAVRFLREERGVGRVALIGHSAGAVSAILSAARNPQVAAVVAVAPFNGVSEIWDTSRPRWIPAVVTDWTLWVLEQWRGFHRERVRPLDVVSEIAPRPLLIIHGTADERITENQARLLFAAAAAPKTLWLVEGAGHRQIRDPVLDLLAPDLITFLRSALRQQPGGLAGDPGVSAFGSYTQN